jgi:hypothetical protein
VAVQLSSAREAEKRWRNSWVDSWVQFCTSGSIESPLLEAVARERLLKTLQARENLMFAAVFCKVWSLAVAL